MILRRLVALVFAALVLAYPGAGWSASAPSWTFDLVVSRWVAPSQFSAHVVRQLAGLHVRDNLPVTLRLDRRTVCRRKSSDGRSALIRCATVRAIVALRNVTVRASGQLETSHLGAIGFRARRLLVTTPDP